MSAGPMAEIPNRPASADEATPMLSLTRLPGAIGSCRLRSGGQKVLIRSASFAMRRAKTRQSAGALRRSTIEDRDRVPGGVELTASAQNA